MPVLLKMLQRFSEEVQEGEGDGLSILSGSSGSTSGSALSSNSSGKEEKFTDILKTTKENGGHNETKLLTSKTKSKKYEQSDDLK